MVSKSQSRLRDSSSSYFGVRSPKGLDEESKVFDEKRSRQTFVEEIKSERNWTIRFPYLNELVK